jgi:hypothetical protein
MSLKVAQQHALHIEEHPTFFRLVDGSMQEALGYVLAPCGLSSNRSSVRERLFYVFETFQER